MNGDPQNPAQEEQTTEQPATEQTPADDGAHTLPEGDQPLGGAAIG